MKKRKLVANMVPPPFARAMQMAVDRVLQNALQIGRRVGENVAGSLPPTPKEPADQLTAPGLGADPCPIDVERAQRSVRFSDKEDAAPDVEMVAAVGGIEAPTDSEAAETSPAVAEPAGEGSTVDPSVPVDMEESDDDGATT